MQLNSAGINLIRTYEGCRLVAYQDQGGIWTIGFGTTGPDIVDGIVWTQDQAEARLESDLNRFAVGVSNVLANDIGDNRFSACVSLAYNIGLTAFATSHLCILLNGGDYTDAAAEFPKWDHCNGQVVHGLLNRRLAEQKLFLS
jgi:lysozyme